MVVQRGYVEGFYGAAAVACVVDVGWAVVEAAEELLPIGGLGLLLHGPWHLGRRDRVRFRAEGEVVQVG